MMEWPGQIGGNFVVGKITGGVAKKLQLPICVHSATEEFYVTDTGGESKQESLRHAQGTEDRAQKVYEYDTPEQLVWYIKNRMLHNCELGKNGKAQNVMCYRAKGGAKTEIWLPADGMPGFNEAKPLGLREAEVYIRHLVASMAREFSTRQSTKGTSDMAVRVRGEAGFIQGNLSLEVALVIQSDIPDLPLMVSATLYPENRSSIKWGLLCMLAGTTVVVDGVHNVPHGGPRYKSLVADMYCGATLAKRLAISEHPHQLVSAHMTCTEETRGFKSQYNVTWGIRNGQTNLFESREEFQLSPSKIEKAMLDGKIPS